MKANTEQQARGSGRGAMMPTAIPNAPLETGDLRVDQPSVPVPATVVSAVSEALLGGQTHYVDVPGIPGLREKLAQSVAGRLADACEQANVVVTAGVQEARFLALNAIVEPTATVAAPGCIHQGAHDAMRLRSRQIVSIAVDADAGYVPSVRAISDALDQGARVVYLENPVRLTGAVMQKDALAEIAELLAKHDAQAVLDQGLEPWVVDEARGATEGKLDLSRFSILGEAFPGHGLEGWGVGFLAASTDRVASATKLKQIMSICTSTPAQYAALAAADGAAGEHATQRTNLSSLRSQVAAAAQRQGLEVVGGSVAHLIALQGPQVDDALARLKQEGLHVADGALFGVGGTIRLSIHDADDVARIDHALR